MTTIPSDPFMLMSYVNQQLRDNYDSLDEFCKSIDIDKNELLQKLNAAGFEYNPDTICISNMRGEPKHRLSFAFVGTIFASAIIKFLLI